MINILEIQNLFADRNAQALALGGALLLVWIVATVIAHIRKSAKKKKELKESAEYILLQITQTPHTDTQMSEMEEIRLFEDLIHSIVPEKKPIIFEVAVTNEGSEIQFFIATPSAYVETVKTQVRRVFERAQAQEVDDYTIFHAQDPNTVATLTLKNFYALPIRSYRHTETDSFAPILAAFANAKEKRTGVAMQLVLQKASKKQTGEMKKVLKGLKKGKSLKQLKPTKTSEKVDQLVARVTEKKDEDEGPASETQLVEDKMQEQNYQLNIRVGVSAQTQEKVDLLFDNLKGRFDQFGSAGHNGFDFTQKKDRKTILDFAFRLLDEKSATVMNAQEVSSIYHLLNQSIEVANLQWMKTKRVAAPTDTAKEGLLLGDNIFHGQETPIYMPDKDRMRHLYVIGQTGTGKTAIIKSMAYQDIQEGRGVCIIDPHGDLVDDMLAIVPEKRIDDVIVFDPSNIEYPLALNMLEYDRSRPQEKTFIVNEILSIFYSLFDAETMGPVFEQYMRNSLLLLMEGKVDEPATLMDVPVVLTDEKFRAEMLKNCHNEPVKKFWEEEAQKAGGDAALENIAPYITSKFSNFISNDYVRPIISQPHSSFSFRKAMDDGKMLFVRLPKGKIGEINARLLGMIVSGKLALAAFSRDDVAEDDRRPFYFYIDEFQNFTSDSIEQILSEARKYKLSLNIAHQYMAQLTDSIRGAVLGNVGTTISFRVGVEDAEILEKKFTPQFSAIELTETENLNCVVGMLSNSKPLSPFTMKIRFSPRGSQEVKENIIKYSSLKHSTKKPEPEPKPTKPEIPKMPAMPTPPARPAPPRNTDDTPVRPPRPPLPEITDEDTVPIAPPRQRSGAGDTDNTGRSPRPTPPPMRRRISELDNDDEVSTTPPRPRRRIPAIDSDDDTIPTAPPRRRARPDTAAASRDESDTPPARRRAADTTAGMPPRPQRQASDNAGRPPRLRDDRQRDDMDDVATDSQTPPPRPRRPRRMPPHPTDTPDTHPTPPRMRRQRPPSSPPQTTPTPPPNPQRQPAYQTEE